MVFQKRQNFGDSKEKSVASGTKGQRAQEVGHRRFLEQLNFSV